MAFIPLLYFPPVAFLPLNSDEEVRILQEYILMSSENRKFWIVRWAVLFLEDGLIRSLRWAARMSIAHSASSHEGVSTQTSWRWRRPLSPAHCQPAQYPMLLGADQLTQHTMYHISTHFITSLLTTKDHYQILWIKGNVLWLNNGGRHWNHF